MKYKLGLFICITIASFVRISAFAQSSGTQPKKVTLNFNSDTVYNSSIDFAGDSILIIRDIDNYKPVIFKKQTNFDSVTFLNYANFHFATFKNELKFDGATFQNEADFGRGTFIKIVDFDNAKFQRNADFSPTTFQEEAHFRNDTFQKDVRFKSATFQKNAFFFNTVFQKYVVFEGATFHKQANFGYATFRKYVDFSNLENADSTIFEFTGAQLPDLIDFSNNSGFHNDVDFTTADFDSSKLYTYSTRRWHYINIYKSDISKIKIDYQHFRLCFYSTNRNNQGGDYAGLPIEFSADSLSYNISMDSLKYNKKLYSLEDPLLYKQLLELNDFQKYLKLIFPSNKIADTVVMNFLVNCVRTGQFPRALPKDEIISIYQKVLKNFDTNGQQDSYETLDIEYRDFKNGWFIVPHLWYCYGYHKEWIFLWTGGFLLIFTLITFFFIHKLNRKIEDDGFYYIPNIPPVEQSKTISSLVKRVWYSFIYTSAIFFLIGLKTENVNFKKVGAIYIILIYSFGLLCLGYMANFVLQK